ncbi:hypothetical protein BH11PSE11_BH11PSE11_02360 [soil metagenome]
MNVNQMDMVSGTLRMARTHPSNALWSALSILLAGLVTFALVEGGRYVPELGYDESASILGMSILSGHFGNHPDPNGLLGFSRHFVMDCYPPVYYMVQAVLFKFFGFSIVVARAASALFVGATALLCFWGGKKIAGPAAGFLAMAVYLIVPLQIYTLVARPDVAVPFFLLASLLVLGFADEDKASWRAFAFAGLLFSLAVLSHFVALMAGPVVAALLWRKSGLRFWQAGRFYAFLTGFFVPMVCYAVLLYPHYPPTFQHLVHYADVGLAAKPASVWEQWPLRPTLQHVKYLRSDLPWLLFGLLPLSVAVAFAGFRSSALRMRVTAAGWQLTICFVGLWLLVGAYPNIAVYGYYGPVYLALGAVVAAYLLVTPLPAGWLEMPVVIAVCAAFPIAMTVALAKHSWSAGNSNQKVPITAPLAWTEEFPLLPQTKVLATPHWVFSSAADHVRTYRILKFNEGAPSLFDQYKSEVAESGDLADYGAAIFDKWNEYHVLQQLTGFAALQTTGAVADLDPNKIRRADIVEQQVRRAEPEARAGIKTAFSPFATLASRSYRVVGLHSDSRRVSAEYSVLTRADNKTGSFSEWPKMAISGPSGPTNLTIHSSCTVSVPGPLLPPSEQWAPWLTTYALSLEAVPEAKDLVLALRIVADSGGPAHPMGFVAYFPDASQAFAARRALASYVAPAVSVNASFGLLGFAMNKGEVGREMLIRPGLNGGGGVLSLHVTEPVKISRIDMAFALASHQKCDAVLVNALGKMRDNAVTRRKALPEVVRMPANAVAGLPLNIELSAKSSGEMVFWRDGKILGRQGFEDSDVLQITPAEAGQLGIEIWFAEESVSKSRRVVPVHLVVVPKP